jgi:hypothetical protein
VVCGSIVVRVGGNVLFVGQGAVADAQAGGTTPVCAGQAK